MQKKRFIARDMRRALDLIKEEFGEDAMIISTERTAEGVELIAGIDQLPETEKVQEVMTMNHHQQKIANAASRFSSKTQLAQEIDIANKKMLASRKAQNMTLESISQQETIKSEAIKKEALQQAHKPDESYDNDIRRLQHEISDMRSSIEQFIDFQRKIPVADEKIDGANMAHVRQQMNKLGLIDVCQNKLLELIRYKKIPSDKPQALWTHAMVQLAKNINVDLTDPVSNGGRYLFLGATGVGKTTTIAKLAARYVMQNNAHDIVILSTDNYRLASHDQLRSLCKILDVDVQIVPHISELPEYMSLYKQRKLILVDTPGITPPDSSWQAYMSVLQQCRELRAISVFSATSQFPMMQSLFSHFHDADPDYSVVTKIDECHDLGSILSILFLNDTPLAYIANGQAVPDDLLMMRATQLVATSVDVTKRYQKNSHLYTREISRHQENQYMN